MAVTRLIILGLVLAVTPLVGHAVIIIDNTTTGLYNAGLGDLTALDGAGGFFLGPNVGEGDPDLPPIIPEPSVTYGGAFGTNWLGGDYSGGAWSFGAIPATWAVDTETAIVYDFTLASTSDVHIDLGVDNGILVWLNGNYVFGAQASGGAFLSEYDIDLNGLAAGAHSLQILREDHGGGTGFGILADAVAVPEPTTVSLLGLGLLGLGAIRRKLAR